MHIVVNLLIAFAVILAGLAWIALTRYNRLTEAMQNVHEARSNAEVAVSKKLSLVNQLIDVVQSYRESEQLSILKVSQDNVEASIAAAYAQTGTVMAAVQGLADRFPNLKASEQYSSLVLGIRECESEVQASRNRLNQVVKEYNNLCLKIPTVFVARFMGFRPEPYLNFDLGAADGPKSLKALEKGDGARLDGLFQRGNAAPPAALPPAARPPRPELVARTVQTTAYFYRSPGGTPMGPATLGDLRQLYRQGSLEPSTQILQEGAAEWQPIASLPGDGERH